MMINSNPEGTTVLENGASTGATPRNHTFDYSPHTYCDVTVRKPGYLDMTMQLIADTELAGRGTLIFDLPQDPSWQETTTSQAANQWLRVQVAERITREVMWQTLVDAVSSRYSNIEQLDAGSGYIRSAPIARTYKHPTKGDFIIRTQFLGSISTNQPLVYKMKIQGEYSEHPGQWIPFERIFSGDQQLIDELQSRLGLK
jgi:hypothetical protein